MFASGYSSACGSRTSTRWRFRSASMRSGGSPSQGSLPRTLESRDRRGGQLANREAQRHPCRHSPFEGTDAGDPPALELKRHPGARGFVGSGAVENQLAIPGDVRQMLVERLGRDPAAAGNGIRRGGHVQRGAEVEDGDVLPGLELLLEVLRRDPGDPEAPE